MTLEIDRTNTTDARSVANQFYNIRVNIRNGWFGEAFIGHIADTSSRVGLDESFKPKLYAKIGRLAFCLGKDYENAKFPKGHLHDPNALALGRFLIPLWKNELHRKWENEGISISSKDYEDALRWMLKGGFKDPAISFMSNLALVKRVEALSLDSLEIKFDALKVVRNIQLEANRLERVFSAINDLEKNTDISELELLRKDHLRPANLRNNLAVSSLDCAYIALLIKTKDNKTPSVVSDTDLGAEIAAYLSEANQSLEASHQHIRDYGREGYHPVVKRQITADSNLLYLAALDLHSRLVGGPLDQNDLALSLNQLNDQYQNIDAAIADAPHPTCTPEGGIVGFDKQELDDYFEAEMKYRAAYILFLVVLVEDTIAEDITPEVTQAKCGLLRTFMSKFYPEAVGLKYMPSRSQILDFGEELLNTALAANSTPDDKVDRDNFRRMYTILRQNK